MAIMYEVLEIVIVGRRTHSIAFCLGKLIVECARVEIPSQNVMKIPVRFSISVQEYKFGCRL